MEKQKNISMDVKNGVSELEELLDVSGDYRRSWKTAEIERGAATRLAAVNTRYLPNAVSTETPNSSQGKRSASSPAEVRPGKKSKTKSKTLVVISTFFP